MLIETDSPYLAPVPFRGKRNQPAYVPHVAAEIARLRGIALEEVAQATTANFFRLFQIDADGGASCPLIGPRRMAQHRAVPDRRRAWPGRCRRRARSRCRRIS